MSETVLVTGGTGFVAGWCIVELLERGYAVRTTVRGAGKRPPAGADQVEVVAADLTADDGWDAAMAGVDYVLHVASPLGTDSADPDTLVRAARDGTLRVLRAATEAGVKRVVMTSSTAACTGPGGTPGDETVWTDPAERGVTPYRRSKILAERAAWDFATTTELTTVLPGAIFGPVLTAANLGSVELIQRLLTGRPPALPRVGFTVIDVRDLADLHIRAMTAPAAAGERFIAAGQFMSFADMAGVLRARVGDRATKVPTREAPDFLVRVLARFIPPLRAIVPLLGSPRVFSAAKAKRMLGFVPRPGAETIGDCAESLSAPVPSRA